MKKILSIFARAVITTMLVVSAASCGKLDVVGNDSVRAFGELLQNAPQLVSEDECCWFISAPDASVKFAWNKDSPYNVSLEIDAAPFIAAGLDPSKLPAGFTSRGGKLTVGSKWTSEASNSRAEETTPLSSYQQIVKLRRDAIGYHGQMDHYGINIGDGNLFEWAKNMSTNDKDIVFVLDPAPFISAGVDPNSIEGWLFAKVPVDDENGRMVEVDKILKPFDLL